MNKIIIILSILMYSFVGNASTEFTEIAAKKINAKEFCDKLAQDQLSEYAVGVMMHTSDLSMSDDSKMRIVKSLRVDSSWYGVTHHIWYEMDLNRAGSGDYKDTVRTMVKYSSLTAKCSI